MNLGKTLQLAPLVLSVGSSMTAQWWDGGRMPDIVKSDMKMCAHKYSLITMGVVSLMQFARGDINNMLDITIPSMFAEFTKGANDDSVMMRWLGASMSYFFTYRNY